MALIAGLLALGLGAGVLNSGGNEKTFLALQALARQWPDGFWATCSGIGSTWGMLALLAPLLLLRPRWCVAVLYTVPFALLYTYSLKYGFALPRPALVLPAAGIHLIGASPTSPAFPSGHSVTAFAVAAILCSGLWREARFTLAAGVLLMAGLIAFSRIAVGAHWPLDVIAGALGGWCCGRLGLQRAQRRALPGKYLQASLATGCAAAAVAAGDRFSEAPVWLAPLVSTWGLTAAALAFYRIFRPAHVA